MNFDEYLHSRPRTPLTEAVVALYEGYTKSDMALGKHLKSLDATFIGLFFIIARGM